MAEKMIERVANYSSDRFDAQVDVMRVKLDEKNQVYYLSSSSSIKPVEISASLLMSERPTFSQSAREAIIQNALAAGRHTQALIYGGVISPETEMTFESGEVANPERVAMLVYAALADTALKDVMTQWPQDDASRDIWENSLSMKQKTVIDSDKEPTLAYAGEVRETAWLAGTILKDSDITYSAGPFDEEQRELYDR